MSDDKGLIEKLKKEIVEVLREIGSYTLTSILSSPSVYPLAQGEKSFYAKGVRGGSDPLLCKNVNMAFIRAIEELQIGDVIELHRTTLDVIQFDDGIKYNDEDWLPIEVKWGKNFPK